MENHLKLFYGTIAISLLLLLNHFLVWQYIIVTEDLTWSRVLIYWDSKWYNQIIRFGYYGRLWAFFPLYPSLVYVASMFSEMQTQWLGTLISTALFLFVSLAVAYLLMRSYKGEFLPKNLYSWFFFVYAAGSYVYHSLHTESLFLMCSFLAFLWAYEGKFIPASIFAGLSWLTRHQGFFVSLCVALLAASDLYKEGQKKKAIQKFALYFGMSFALFSIYPWYQYWQTDSMFAFIHSQKYWSHATDVYSIFKTFWFGNPEQMKFSDFVNGIHTVYYFFLWGLVYFLWKKDKILALYCGLSLFVLLFQVSLLNIFRFGTVLFPLHFYLGEKVSTSPLWVKGLSIFMLLALNHYVTWNYVKDYWAY